MSNRLQDQRKFGNSLPRFAYRSFAVFVGIVLLSNLGIGIARTNAASNRTVGQITQQEGEGELYYTYFDKKIPLTQRTNAIAVAFKPAPRASARSLSAPQPLHLQLQQELQRGGASTRSLNSTAALKVEVSPLGENYALVNVLASSRSASVNVEEQIKQNDVVLFMKGTKQFPQCGFSGQVVQILNYVGAEYQEYNVLENDALREGIKEFSNWPTIPQLYVCGEFIGGSDIMIEMYQTGELGEMIEKVRAM